MTTGTAAWARDVQEPRAYAAPGLTVKAAVVLGVVALPPVAPAGGGGQCALSAWDRAAGSWDRPPSRLTSYRGWTPPGRWHGPPSSSPRPACFCCWRFWSGSRRRKPLIASNCRWYAWDLPSSSRGSGDWNEDDARPRLSVGDRALHERTSLPPRYRPRYHPVRHVALSLIGQRGPADQGFDDLHGIEGSALTKVVAHDEHHEPTTVRD